jgi:anti-sigma factor RsiW
MIDRDSIVTEDELHAYVDGDLPSDRRAAVEAWLATHADDASRVAAWRTQIELLRTRYGAIAAEPVPAQLALERFPRTRQKWIGLAAAATIAAFIVGGATGWWVHGASAASQKGLENFTSEAVDAHKLYVVEVRHPVEVPGTEAAHLEQWLSKRLGYQLRAPDLDRVGLKLVGGRLLPGPTGAAAFFMYENGSGQRFTLYCGRMKAPDTALRFQTLQQIAALYWVEKDVVYVVSGESDRGTLQKIAEVAYDQIEANQSGTADGT